MNPEDDPIVKKLLEATTDEERLAIEREALVQSDNRPRPEDGPQPEDEQ